MKKVEELCVNTIRILSAESVQKANSGHPGMPMGAAAMAYTLWGKSMKHNPANPGWADRDRFVLSAGHGSMLLYSLLHLFGYGLAIEDLKSFRQLDSKTPGHPEYGHTVGVETTTGPLGQGIANSVGMAIAESYLAAKFNRPGFEIVNHFTYAIAGDGCMMEGIASEAASLAGTLALGKLIVLYDSNNISIEGNTDIAFREDVGKRFEAYGWQVLKVDDGNDIDAIYDSLEKAKRDLSKPSLIIVKTQIGYGCPDKQGKASVHGEPLGEECLAATKKFLGLENYGPFEVPSEVTAHLDGIRKQLAEQEVQWNSLYQEYKKNFPELAREWELWQSGKIDMNYLDSEEFWSFDPKSNATRNVSGEIINRLAKVIPNLIGGSADLAPSNKTNMKGRGDFSAEDRAGSNLHFGVREHAMAAIGNAIALHGGLLPYVSTFFVFSDYMKPAMRLSALMGLKVVYVLTHDSIGVGEDGPTHEPIEHLASLRSIPGFTVIRPADSRETAAAWYTAVTNNGPTALVLTRQNLPQLDGTGKEALKGGYILVDSKKEIPDAIIIATGSEVQLAYQAAPILKERGIDVRVVSMPSWELFDRQPVQYKEKVLPQQVRARLAIEACSSFGWQKYVGLDGDTLCMEGFGASAPAELLFKKFGFTVDNVVQKVQQIVKK